VGRLFLQQDCGSADQSHRIWWDKATETWVIGTTTGDKLFWSLAEQSQAETGMHWKPAEAGWHSCANDAMVDIMVDVLQTVDVLEPGAEPKYKKLKMEPGSSSAKAAAPAKAMPPKGPPPAHLQLPVRMAKAAAPAAQMAEPVPPDSPEPETAAVAEPFAVSKGTPVTLGKGKSDKGSKGGEVKGDKGSKGKSSKDDARGKGKDKSKSEKGKGGKKGKSKKGQAEGKGNSLGSAAELESTQRGYVDSVRARGGWFEKVQLLVTSFLQSEEQQDDYSEGMYLIKAWSRSHHTMLTKWDQSVYTPKYDYKQYLDKKSRP
jgi:hypothetical protein